MKAPQSEKFSLKDHLFNPGKINQIAKEIDTLINDVVTGKIKVSTTN
jgi:hypothetical protein